MEILQGVWKQHLRPRAVVGYGIKIFSPVLQITSPDHLAIALKDNWSELKSVTFMLLSMCDSLAIVLKMEAP